MGAFCGLSGRAAADADRRESKGGTDYATCRGKRREAERRRPQPGPRPAQGGEPTKADIQF